MPELKRLSCLQVQEFGVCEVRDLKPNGANILVTEENKKEYVHLVCQMKMTGEFIFIQSSIPTSEEAAV